ncbi:MAG: hypothetical protein GY793_09250 [Proteobacteria bacterium]|nr:hypothetical protein [Pseudomonadota bacterium]
MRLFELTLNELWGLTRPQINKMLEDNDNHIFFKDDCMDLKYFLQCFKASEISEISLTSYHHRPQGIGNTYYDSIIKLVGGAVIQVRDPFWSVKTSRNFTRMIRDLVIPSLVVDQSKTTIDGTPLTNYTSKEICNTLLRIAWDHNPKQFTASMVNSKINEFKSNIIGYFPERLENALFVLKN